MAAFVYLVSILCFQFVRAQTVGLTTPDVQTKQTLPSTSTITPSTLPTSPSTKTPSTLPTSPTTITTSTLPPSPTKPDQPVVPPEVLDVTDSTTNKITPGTSIETPGSSVTSNSNLGGDVNTVENNVNPEDTKPGNTTISAITESTSGAPSTKTSSAVDAGSKPSTVPTASTSNSFSVAPRITNKTFTEDVQPRVDKKAVTQSITTDSMEAREDRELFIITGAICSGIVVLVLAVAVVTYYTHRELPSRVDIRRFASYSTV